jgi:hypothetical protein
VNKLTTITDFQTRISTTQAQEYIFVDQSDQEVWLSVNVRGGHTHVTIPKEQAKDMIAALIRIVDAM